MSETASSSKSERSSRIEETEIVLGMLSAIEQNQHVTQRTLSQELGIALGLANAYLKRLARKGHIKVQQVPLNRYAYYITPKGFVEKARLTTEYLSVSLSFFRRAREECSALVERCANRGWKRLALAGAGELAEIATLCGSEEARAVAIIDPARAGETLAGLPVVASLAEAGDPDAVLVTDMSRPQETFEALLAALPAERVLAPALLRVRPPEQEAEAGETVQVREAGE